MARTGRPNIPTERKAHDGTLRARDIQTPLIVSGRKPPEKPAYLTALQGECFDQIVRELSDGGILDTSDRGMLELAAIEEANIIECNQTIERDGRFIEHVQDRGARNIREHPAAASQRQSIASLRQLYGELGIGPANRARFGKMGTTTSQATRERNIPGLDKAHALKVIAIDSQEHGNAGIR